MTRWSWLSSPKVSPKRREILAGQFTVVIHQRALTLGA